MSGNGIAQWLQDNVITVILLVIAAAALWAGKSGNISKVVTIFVCAILGVAILAFATTGAGVEIGTWVIGLLRG